MTNWKTMMWVLALLFWALFPNVSQAKSLRDAQMEALDAVHMSEVSKIATSEAMTVYYVGTSTEAYLRVLTTAITAYTPFATADTDFGTSGTYDLGAAAYDTMGELCDAIEALSDYNCTLEGAKRDDDTALLDNQAPVNNATTDLARAAGFSIIFDSGGEENYGYDLRVGVNPMEGRRVLLKECIENSAGTGVIKVFGKLRKFKGPNSAVIRDDTTLVWEGVATANNTDKTVTWAINGVGGIDFLEGEHVVVSAGNGTDVQGATNKLDCRWEER